MMPNIKYNERELLRNILLNTLFYYNSPEKVETFEKKLKNIKVQSKKEGDEHVSEDISVTDELTAIKTL